MAVESDVSIEAPGRPTNIRWMVFGLASSTSFLLYVHRYTWAFVKADVAEEFGWDAFTLGVLDSCFLASYAIGQIPLGMVGDWFGPRAVLGATIILWSLAMGAAGLAVGQVSMGASRFAFGLAQSGCYSSLTKITKLWFPPNVRTAVQGWVASFFGRSGGAFSYFLFATVMLAWWGLDWRSALYVLTFIGIAFGGLFYFAFRNTPAEHPWANAAEAELVTSADPDSATATRSKVKWKTVFTDRNMRYFLFQQFTSAYADNLYSLWIPLFLLIEKRVDLSAAGWMAALPLLGGACGGMSGGTLQNSLIVRTGNRRWVRSAIGCIGKLMAAILMFVSLGYDSAVTIVWFLFFVKFFGDWSQPTVWGTATDIGGRNSASVFATVNMMGSFAGFVAGPTMGAIIVYFSQNVSVEAEHARLQVADSAPTNGAVAARATLEQRGLLPGSMQGRVYDAGRPIAAFTVNEQGTFNLTSADSAASGLVARTSKVNWNKGELTLAWEERPSDPAVVVDYQYTRYGAGWTALFIALSVIYLASSISWLFVDCTKKLED